MFACCGRPCRRRSNRTSESQREGASADVSVRTLQQVDASRVPLPCGIVHPSVATPAGIDGFLGGVPASSIADSASCREEGLERGLRLTFGNPSEHTTSFRDGVYRPSDQATLFHDTGVGFSMEEDCLAWTSGSWGGHRSEAPRAATEPVSTIRMDHSETPPSARSLSVRGGSTPVPPRVDVEARWRLLQGALQDQSPTRSSAKVATSTSSRTRATRSPHSQKQQTSCTLVDAGHAHASDARATAAQPAVAAAPPSCVSTPGASAFTSTAPCTGPLTREHPTRGSATRPSAGAPVPAEEGTDSDTDVPLATAIRRMLSQQTRTAGTSVRASASNMGASLDTSSGAGRGTGDLAGLDEGPVMSASRRLPRALASRVPPTLKPTGSTRVAHDTMGTLASCGSTTTTDWCIQDACLSSHPPSCALDTSRAPVATSAWSSGPHGTPSQESASRAAYAVRRAAAGVNLSEPEACVDKSVASGQMTSGMWGTCMPNASTHTSQRTPRNHWLGGATGGLSQRRILATGLMPSEGSSWSDGVHNVVGASAIAAKTTVSPADAQDPVEMMAPRLSNAPLESISRRVPRLPADSVVERCRAALDAVLVESPALARHAAGICHADAQIPPLPAEGHSEQEDAKPRLAVCRGPPVRKTPSVLERCRPPGLP
eukprot:TRINITY_DN44301_c0_g1_i1.p1 TRINITY_DN44301_c0_g1~~TRINITY_DN44301_c0_g1_i1.p1  ORF type:complete len:659 (+),score=34.59 TRINITY_DN44301_c0_g1_i1:209-2185(+)